MYIFISEDKDLSQMNKSNKRKTPKMSTYTIALAVLSSDYTPVIRQTGKRNVSVVSGYYPNYPIERMLNTTTKFLSFFEKYFNNTDDLPKVDNLQAIAGAYGAMENWGLIVYFGDHNYDLLIGHEVAHYWIGNKVTCSNWNE